MFFFLSVFATRNHDSDFGFLKIVDKNHNHFETLTETHFAFKKIAMTKNIKSEIFRFLQIQISFVRILFNLRIFDSMIELSLADFKNLEMINFMFKIQDIYNMKTQLR